MINPSSVKNMQKIWPLGGRPFARFFSQKDPLKERLNQLIPIKLKEYAEFKSEHKNTVVDQVTLEQVYNGMRGIKAMSYETSLLDAEEGIRFRGMSVFDAREKLPKAKHHPSSSSKQNEEPLPEAIFWLLLTGEVPSSNEVEWLANELTRRAFIPMKIAKLIDSFPENVHPMAQLSASLSCMSYHSKFAKAYSDGQAKKTDYWKFFYEDALDLVAKIPLIAAKIYRNVYHDGILPDFTHCRDLADRYCTLLNVNDSNEFKEYMRLYLTIHCDHEGGNVSAHATKLVSSSLADPFLAFSAGINGLAGPLHGRANQEVVAWLDKLVDSIGMDVDQQQLKEYCEQWLKKSVIPGYGHAVLRKTDPRFEVQLAFAKKHIKDQPMVTLIENLYKVVPGILQATGKVKNPWPNVDAISGTLLDHYGIIEQEYYTVPFGVSRSIGVGASMVWDRIYGLPIERPKSLTTSALKELISKQ